MAQEEDSQSESESENCESDEELTAKSRKFKVKRNTKPLRMANRRHTKKNLLAASIAPRTFDRDVSNTSFEKSRDRLHVSSVPDSLPCREMEYAEVYGQLESFIEEGSGGCICNEH